MDIDDQLQSNIADTLWNGTLADHQDVANDLMAYLTSADGQDLARANAAQYDQLVRQWVLLSFGAFVILPQDEQQDLLKTRLLAAVQAGFSVQDFTQQFFDMYETDEFLAPMFAGFATLLQQNTEQLGTASLDISGTKYLPQVRYWLLDYAKSPSQSARRTSIDRLNYTNTSQNARQLTQVQRSQLLEILKLNDALNSVDRPVERTAQSKTFNASPVPAPVPAAPVPPVVLTPVMPTPVRAAPVPQPPVPPVQKPPLAPPQQPASTSLEAVMANVVAAHVETVKVLPVVPLVLNVQPPVPQIPTPPKSPVPTPVPQPRPQQPASVNILQKDLPRGLPLNEKDLPAPRPQLQPKPAQPIHPPQPAPQQPVKPLQPVRTPQSPPAQKPPQVYGKMAQPKLQEYADQLVHDNLVARLSQPQDFAKLSTSDIHYTHPDKVFTVLLQHIAELARSQQAWVIVQNFEVSPLYQAYIDTGRLLLNDQNADTSKFDVSKEEFEALADFRRNLAAFG